MVSSDIVTEDDLARTDRTVEDYVAARSEPVRTILQALRDLVRQTLPHVTEGMKWGAPVFFDRAGEVFTSTAERTMPILDLSMVRN